MLQSVVHDPTLFTNQDSISALFQVVMATHFESICAYGVLPLPDDRSALISSLRQFSATLPPNKRQRFEAVRDEILQKRTRSVKVSENITTTVENELQAKDELTQCLSVSTVANPDFTLLSDASFQRLGNVSNSAIALKGKQIGKNLIRLTEYPTEPCPSEYNLCEIGYSGFLDSILRPVIRWSDDVWLIDRYINNAFVGYMSPGRAVSGGRNWPKFSQTVQAIIDEWHKVSVSKQAGAKVHVVTELLDWYTTNWRSYGEMAEALHSGLSDGRTDLVVHLVDYKADFRSAIHNNLEYAPQDSQSRVGHGRFLHTSCCTLRFDPGLDIITPDSNKISEGCIVNRSDEAGRKAAQIMIAVASQQQVVRWPQEQPQMRMSNVPNSIGKAFDSMFA